MALAYISLEKLYAYYLKHPYLTTDSRQVIPNSIFFALKGPRFNGNAFAAIALQQGAAYAVIDDVFYQQDERYLLVEDVLTSLQELAKLHRSNLAIPIVGITGSSGKTTTKALMDVVLSQRYQVYATQGNLNNHIGVPISLLSIKPSIEVAIIEMGANHQKEIAKLCEIAMPTHGLITNIGPVHLEGFGGIAGVMLGKGELYDYLSKNHGQAFVNSKDFRLLAMSQRLKNPIYYPQIDDTYTCSLIQATPYVIYQDCHGQTVPTRLLGKHQFYNVAAALCIGYYFGIAADKANQAIQNYQPLANRCQLIRKGSNSVLLDAYNANPESMKAAIQTLYSVQAEDKVLILGDMEELGTYSAAFHKNLVKLTTESNYRAVLLHGMHMQAASSYNPKAIYFKEKADLAAYLQQANFHHTAILIKGSRSLQLETLLEVL
jgi:UDP-N-acetylmuramoyl-tripeptide--D-alanyl-D-alanine ligase